MTPTLTILQGSALDQLRTLPDESVQCCVTSPPYWGLRSYVPPGHPLKGHEIGLEKTPEEFITKMVEVFREVRRVLRKDGTCWVNMGDSYNAYNGNAGPGSGFSRGAACDTQRPKLESGHGLRTKTLKPKDLVGIPWMLAFAMRADGWWLRQDIIWAKPNCMPESVRDRCTRSHEYIFMFTKAERYYYDAEAIREPAKESSINRLNQNVEAQAGSARANGGAKTNGTMKAVGKQRGHSRRHDGFNDRWDGMAREEQMALGANKRSVWRIAPATYADAHFATYPPDLIRPCILAGTKAGDTVLDPFGGSGTTGQVALELGRSAILIELNESYIPMIKARTNVTPGML